MAFCSTSVCCLECNMFSDSPTPFNGHKTCNKCRLLASLEARISVIESRLLSLDHITSLAQTSETQHVDETKLTTLTNATPPSSTPMVTPQLKSQDKWVTVKRGSSRKNKSMSVSHSHPISISNRFSTINITDADDKVLVIGDSTLRHIKLATPSQTVNCISGARANDIESHLKLIAKRRFSKIIIHTGVNDVRLRQSETTKLNFASLLNTATQMADSVVCSGPMPINRGDEMYSRLSSLNNWLAEWCSCNNVDFINNWPTFWRKPGLLQKDGIHPSWEGATLLSQNLIQHLAQTYY